IISTNILDFSLMDNCSCSLAWSLAANFSSASIIA
ncbi:hypothetical protein Tco_0592112, partial [Tanacetum coccineum]